MTSQAETSGQVMKTPPADMEVSGADSPEQTRAEGEPIIEGTCPMPDIAQLIGGKWKLIILQILIFQGMKRFNELRRQIKGITQTMLTNQLRALERDGLVHRKVYAEVPPKVEYSVTESGLELIPFIDQMGAWGERQMAKENIRSIREGCNEPE